MAINQRKAGAILTYVHIVLNNTISLLYTPIALRMLGQSQYGLFGTASSLTSYLSLLSLGIGGAYIRWNTKYRAEKDYEGEKKLNGLFFSIFSVLSFVSLAIGVVIFFVAPSIFCATFTSEELSDLQIIILIYVVNSALTLFMTPIFACIQSYERFLILRVVSILSVIITPVINLVILYNGGRAVALQFAMLAVSIITFVIYFAYARFRIKMRFSFRGFQKHLLKEILVFSGFLFLNTITDLLTDSTDNMILGITSGTIAVAIYTVGHNFKNYFIQFSSAVSGVFYPKVNQIVMTTNDNKVLTELMTRIGRLQFYIVSLLMIGYAAVGKPFISIWAGEDYGAAYVIGLLLLAGAYIPLFQNIGIEIQKAKNKHKIRSIVYLGVAVANVILTIPFAIMWEGIGAALATFLCCLAGNVLFMNIYYQKGIRLDMGYFWKNILKIVPSFIPTIAVCVLINMFLPIYNIKWLLLAVIIILVVYLVSIYSFAMNDYEKDLLRGPFKKILGKFKKRVK